MISSGNGRTYDALFRPVPVTEYVVCKLQTLYPFITTHACRTHYVQGACRCECKAEGAHILFPVKLCWCRAVQLILQLELQSTEESWPQYEPCIASEYILNPSTRNRSCRLGSPLLSTVQQTLVWLPTNAEERKSIMVTRAAQLMRPVSGRNASCVSLHNT